MTKSPTVYARIEAELAHNYLGYTPATLLIHLIGAVLMLWPMQAGTGALIWLGCNVACQALRFVGWWRYQRRSEDEDAPLRAVNYQALGLFADGMMWGLAPWVFFATAPPLGQIYVFATIVVMAIGTTMINAPFARARLAFCLPALVLGGVRALHVEGTQFTAIGIVLIVSIPVVIYYGAYWGELLRSSIAMRHENRALIAELTVQKAATERASIAKSQFFAAANHDLRQPIHALGLYASALRDAEQGREGAALATKIIENVDVLESLFDELLDIAKLDAGAVTASPHDFMLAPVFARLAALYGLAAERNGVRLRFARTRRALHTDPALLERILSNLISNAIRFTPGGAVLIGARRRGDQVAIEVRDSGMGIPAEAHAHIFDEFAQLNNPERDRRKGLGLGLATVRRLASLLNTPVELESRPGHGSTFRITAPSGDPARTVNETIEARDLFFDVLADKRVLVIDDDEAVRDAMQRVLAGWRANCIAVSSLEEALRACAQCPHVVVADFRLHGDHTGIVAISALRQRFGTELPALLITGDASDKAFAAAKQAELLLLTKPLRAARLRSALTHLLR